MMNFRRMLGMLVLCSQMAACSSWKPMILPPAHPDDVPAEGRSGDVVDAGDEVRLTLRDGGVLDGRVLRWDAGTMTIERQPRANVEVPAAAADTLVVARESVLRVESPKRGGNVVLALVGGVAVGVLLYQALEHPPISVDIGMEYH